MHKIYRTLLISANSKTKRLILADLASSNLRPAVAIIYTGVSACFAFGIRAAAYFSKTTRCSLDSDGLLTNEERPAQQ